MQASLKAGKVTTLPNVNTIADGTAVKTPGEKIFPYIQKNLDDIITVDDDELVVAFLDMVENHKMVIENFLSTIYCTAMTSLFTNLLTPVGAVTTDPLLASLTGSALMAVSMGWVFKAGSTTGGTDIIIKLLRLKFPYLKTGALFFLTDVVIVIASAFVFRNIDKALYAGIVVIITSVVLDVVLYGRDEAN